MSNEQLKHIFDNSTCLTKKQLRSYVHGSMTNEEAHAAEVHLNSCPLCSDAVDGLYAQQENGLAGVNEINADFLKDHFGKINPQVHLNSIAATQHTKHISLQRKKEKVHHLWRTASIAAGILLLAGAIWYYRLFNPVLDKPQIAQDLATQPQQEIEAKDPVPSQAIAMNEPATEAVAKKKEAVELIKDAKPIKGAMTDDIALAPSVVKTDKTAEKEMEEVVVTQYKVPLIGEDERKVITSDEIEKLPTRTTQSVAGSAAGVFQNKDTDMSIASRRMGNSYTADGIETVAKNKNVKQAKESVKVIDKLEQADRLFEAKKYSDALNIYTQEMRDAENKSERQQAAVGAARSYIALGKKEKAKEILESIVDEGGPYRREAKKMLKELE